MNAHIDPQRARHLMRAADLDALLFCTPENFFYSTGFSSMILHLYRQAPLALALLPARASIEPAILVPALEVAAVQRTSGIQSVYSFPIWWEVYDLDRVAGREGGDLEALLAQDPPQLPEQYDREEIGQLLSDVLRDRGLSGGRIGLELDFVDANTYSVLEQTNPEVAFVDSTSLMYELRSVKSSAEIDALRKACLVTEAGIVTATEGISEGSTVGSITDTFHRGVWGAARAQGLTEAVGNITGQPALEAQGGLEGGSPHLPHSTTVKFDMQVCLSHYHSDVGRTYVFGAPSLDQRRIHDALLKAHRRMRDALRPGVRFCDVYEVARDSFRRSGFKYHSRGHFGHSVGLDAKIEEPPFISAAEGRLLSPGMVLAVETPFYCSGVGMFQIEDMCLITQDGHEVLNELPHELQQLSGDF